MARVGTTSEIAVLVLMTIDRFLGSAFGLESISIVMRGFLERYGSFSASNDSLGRFGRLIFDCGRLIWLLFW